MRIIAFAVLVLFLTASVYSVEVKSKGAAMSDSVNVNSDSLLAEADSLFQERDISTALTKYLRTAEVARLDFNRQVETEALAQVARCYLTLDNKEESRKWLEDAASRASDDDPMGWSRYLGVKGRYEWKDGDKIKPKEEKEPATG